MKIYQGGFGRALAVGVLAQAMLTANVALAGFGLEDFESHASGTPLNAVGQGWGSDSSGVIVSNMTSLAGTNVLYLPTSTMVSNAVNTASVATVWTEFTVLESAHLTLETAPLVDSNLVVMVGVSTGGHAMVYDTNGWVECVTDVWGTNVTVATGEWARYSIFNNYTNHTAALFLNGHLMREQLSFINTNVSAYNTFRVDSGNDSPGLLDNAFISNAIPPFLASVDLDDDGVADALEIQQVGNVSTIQRLPVQVSVTNTSLGTLNGGTVTPPGPFLVKHNGQTNLALTASSTYMLDRVWVDGVVVTNFNAGLASGTFIWTGITSSGTATVGFVQKPTVSVPGDFSSLSNALAAMVAGTTVQVASSTAESLAITKSVTLAGTSAGLSGSSLSLGAGVTVSVSGFTNMTVNGSATLGANSLLVLSNSVASFSNLVFLSGSVLRVANGTATVNGVTLTGTFDLDASWSGGAWVAQRVNYTDDFENYGAGVALNRLGYFGWAASSPNAVVQTAVRSNGLQAALIPGGAAVSNAVNVAGANKVWVDLCLRGSDQIDPAILPVADGNSVVLLGFATNGWLMAYNSDLSTWETLSNDVMKVRMPTVGTNQWARLTIFQDFSVSPRTVAIFVNGRLVRQLLPFVTPILSTCQGVVVESENSGTSYLDTVRIWTNIPPTLTSGPVNDLNHDGIADAIDIQQNGFIDINISGAVYKIR